MSLTILAEGLDYMWVRFITISLERTQNHAQAAVRHDRPLQWSFGLQPDDDFILAIDVTRRVRRNRTWDLGNVEHAFAALLDEHILQLFPNPFGALGRGGEKLSVALVGGVVLLEKPAHVDVPLPKAGFESAPGVLCVGSHESSKC